MTTWGDALPLIKGGAKLAEQQIKLLQYYIARARLWKQAAKGWREAWGDMEDALKQSAHTRREAEAKAARRLALLREIDRDTGFCAVCRSRKISSAGEKVHREGCELAKELADADS